MSDWTPGEMLAVAASQLVRPNDVALVGLGLPQVAAVLAKRTSCPEATLLLELGVFNPRPTESAMGIADPRMWEGADVFGSMFDMLGYMLQGGRVSLGLLGSLQVDPFGTINSTLITNDEGSPRRFNGSGGSNDIASLAERTLVVVKHSPRKFREVVEFATSPGRQAGGRRRAELGLPGEGPVAVVTDRAIIEITDEGAVLRSVHPGEDPDAVLAATPMPITVPSGGPSVTAPPTTEQLKLIRTELDPNGWYTR